MLNSNGRAVVSLFSGIGGFELGLEGAGFSPRLFCESDPHARAVLKAQWPDVEIAEDIRKLKSIPKCDVVTAGFPCQDLSQAGKKAGIAGENSGLVDHLFRLVAKMRFEPEWIVVENVPFMLSLDRGHAMQEVLRRFEALGFAWAYRVVDVRSFGLPQRRHRVLLLASRIHDPAAALWSETNPALVDLKPSVVAPNSAYGFYWTEGSRGLGWVRNALPPIKGGSGLGIPSPPAVWIPSSKVLGKPSISDGERLQGFPVDWTLPAVAGSRSRTGVRWKLIGNAVNVEVAKWLGSRIAAPGRNAYFGNVMKSNEPWPQSGRGSSEGRSHLMLNAYPSAVPLTSITKFLKDDLTPLSQKAALGFLHRALTTPKLVYSPIFIDFLKDYCNVGATYLYGGVRRIAI